MNQQIKRYTLYLDGVILDGVISESKNGTWVKYEDVEHYNKEGNVKMETALCKLEEPATCVNRVDGRFTCVILCGGVKFDDKVEQCPYRALAEIREITTKGTTK